MALMVYCVLVLVQLVSTDIRNDEKVKRILVNDPDVAHQVMLLKQEMEELKNKLSASEMKSQNMEKEILRLNNSLSASKTEGLLMKREIFQLSSSLNELSTKTSAHSGAVYIRWGRTSCSGSGTELVYSGYTGGQDYYEAPRGGPSNYLCLPHDPELTYRSMSTSSHLFGTEYQENILRSDALDEDVPCAVCQSSNRTSSIMIPGRKSCYSGWTEEYNGYLASDASGHSASTFLCLDKDIEYLPAGVENKDGRLLYMTTTKCGSLSCPPYKDNQLVFCVVCSK